MSFDTLFQFERDLAEFTGAPYVIATDCCTHALELCMRYDRVFDCDFTAFTYISIPQLLTRLNIRYRLTNERWHGEYQFHGTRIWDSARRLERGMYRPGQMQCVSFGWGKPMQLGRAGAILLDDAVAYRVMSCQRSDGRDLTVEPWQAQDWWEPGYHFCPTLETCALGVQTLRDLQGQSQRVEYPDCRKIRIRCV